MATNTRTTEIKAVVSLNGEKIDFARLSIKQQMGLHCDFELIVKHTTFDNHFYDSPEKQMKLTNTKVVIDLLHADQPGQAYVFAGIVTQVQMTAEKGMHGHILIKGKSTTIELERGPIMQTYSNTNLNAICKEITRDTNNLTCNIQPQWESEIDFAMQHRETDWQFLQRICNQYKERFYYSGTELIIGPHPEFPMINLTYDVELSNFEVCSNLVANKFTTYYYDRQTNEKIEQQTPENIDNAPYMLNEISTQAALLNAKRQPYTPVPTYTPDMQSLIDYTRRAKVSTGADMFYVKGTCKTCDVRIGRLIEVRMPRNMGGHNMGTYRIYKTTHIFAEDGTYTCNFEGVPAELEYLPTPVVPLPHPYPLEVKVWDNVDPAGLARVRVEFPFDEKPCQAWFPVMSPDAGGGPEGVVTTNRGSICLPEIGDSCLVGFLDGPELAQPFIMGSMFHGNNTDNAGGGTGNHIKSFTDKSGATLTFNTDEQGQWGITLSDRNGNTIHLDTKGKNIEITAPETMTLHAKNIRIEADEKVEVNATDIKQNAIEKMAVLAKNMSTTIDEEYNLKAETIKEVADVVDIHSMKENMTLYSKKNVENQSSSKKIKLS